MGRSGGAKPRPILQCATAHKPCRAPPLASHDRNSEAAGEIK